jgi:transcriptional regulator with XRE-family HTH domain
MTNTFGVRLRKLRQEKGLSQKRLASAVGVHHTYLSKVESEKLVLAQKVPPLIRDRVLQRPDDFCKLAALDDAALDEVIRQVDRRKKARA